MNPDIAAGCSACACGIESACPQYISPIWLIALAITAIAPITAMFIMKRSKKVSKKAFKITVFFLLAIFTIIAGITTYKYLNGEHLWQENLSSYNDCLKNQTKQSTVCEY